MAWYLPPFVSSVHLKLYYCINRKADLLQETNIALDDSSNPNNYYSFFVPALWC